MTAAELGYSVGIIFITFLVSFLALVLYWKGGNFFRVAMKRYKLKSNKYIR